MSAMEPERKQALIYSRAQACGLAALLLCANMISCPHTCEDPRKWTSPVSLDPDLTFSCSLKEEPKSLTVTYTIANWGSSEFGVFNRIESTQPNGTAKFPANLV